MTYRQSGLMVLPVNYALVAGTIVVRTGTGSLIAAHGDDPVAFEADHSKPSPARQKGQLTE